MKRDNLWASVAAVVSGLLIVAVVRAAQTTKTSTGEPGVLFGSVKVQPGMSIREVEPQLKQKYQLDSGMPDLQWRRYNVLLRPKEPATEAAPAPTKGPILKPPLDIVGTIVFDETGQITRVWRNWGGSQNDQARALGYSLVAALTSLSAEGNTQAKISVKQGRTDNTTLTLDFGGKALELIIYDSPGGAMSVSVAEGVNAD